MEPTARATGRTATLRARLEAAVGIVCAVIGALFAVLVAWWLGVLIAVALAVAIWAGLVGPRLRHAEERALALVGPARPVGDAVEELRLLNLVEGLAPSAGLPRPRCLVIEDPAPNSLVVGRPRHGCLIVTTGLLDRLDRMQLEAIVAHGVVRLRDGAVASTTLGLALTGGRAAKWLGVREVAPWVADGAAAALTRYPPALSAALRILVDAGPAVPASSAPVLARLWIAPPGDAGAVAARIEALDEL